MNKYETARILSAPDGDDEGDFAVDHSATTEGFARIPFYRELNKAFLNRARPAKMTIDVATGTGAAIGWLKELGKLSMPFRAIGIDLSEVDLDEARKKFRSEENHVQFIHGNAEHLPIETESTSLVTALNSVHLYGDQPQFFREAVRVLKAGGELLVNTAYAKGVGVPDRSTLTQWLSIFKFSRQLLENEHGIGNIPKPPDLAQYKPEDYAVMASSAGFSLVETETYLAEIPQDQAKSLVSVREFAEGALPGINLKLGQEALQKAMDMTFEKLQLTTIRRGWMFLHAVK